ncbi:hypothetical protein [Hyphomicrobium sp.]|uniref:hypothetical protein n=1 Tax=Hyphomicrobium sp. TaxID=82 RepID=UPI001D8B7EEA|nr:hypothetical protein [Hyphomicrobium sp.]MBY0561418.1 hypothetical protein [Hyphomicrobium sp.]
MIRAAYALEPGLRELGIAIAEELIAKSRAHLIGPIGIHTIRDAIKRRDRMMTPRDLEAVEIVAVRKLIELTEMEGNNAVANNCTATAPRRQSEHSIRPRGGVRRRHT